MMFWLFIVFTTREGGTKMSRSKNLLIKGVTIEDRNENALDISIYYDEGGYSHFSGDSSARGIYVSLVAKEVGGGSIRHDLFGAPGFKLLLEEMGRFSQKKLDSHSLTSDSIIGLVERFERRYNANVPKESFL